MSTIPNPRSDSNTNLIPLIVGVLVAGLILMGLLVALVIQEIPTQIHRDLPINSHTQKHDSEAEQIYKLILEGQCVTTFHWCGGSEIEHLYTCVDPITGLVGGILVFGEEIATGFYEGSVGYWANRIEREDWKVCQ